MRTGPADRHPVLFAVSVTQASPSWTGASGVQALLRRLPFASWGQALSRCGATLASPARARHGNSSRGCPGVRLRRRHFAEHRSACRPSSSGASADFGQPPLPRVPGPKGVTFDDQEAPAAARTLGRPGRGAHFRLCDHASHWPPGRARLDAPQLCREVNFEFIFNLPTPTGTRPSRRAQDNPVTSQATLRSSG